MKTKLSLFITLIYFNSFRGILIQRRNCQNMWNLLINLSRLDTDRWTLYHNPFL